MANRESYRGKPDKYIKYYTTVVTYTFSATSQNKTSSMIQASRLQYYKIYWKYEEISTSQNENLLVWT